MIRQLTRAALTIQHMNFVTVGTSNQLASVGIDTLGYDAVRMIACIGTLTPTQQTSLSLYECDTLAGSYTLVTGATTAVMADGDSNKLLILDVYKPQKRYVKAQVNRGTANAIINVVIAELFVAGFIPVVQDSTVSQFLVLDNPV